MSEIPESQAKIEAFLSNPAFLRFARNWEVYQRQLCKAVDQGGDSEEIKQRMHELYPDRELPEETEWRERYLKMKKILQQIFESCEAGDFSLEKLAVMIIEAGLADVFLKIWNPKPGESLNIEHHVLVNQAVAYQLDDEGTISLHIKATPLKDTSELMTEILNGFTKIAGLLKEELKDIKHVYMESWLLGSSFGSKIKAIFGEDVKLEDSREHFDPGAQFLALQYNRRALEEYLNTGKKPEVRKLVMTREQFLARFGN